MTQQKIAIFHCGLPAQCEKREPIQIHFFSDLSSNHLESIGGDMFIESPFLSSIDLSSNTSLFSICRSSFVRHEFLQTGIVRHFILSILWKKNRMLMSDLRCW